MPEPEPTIFVPPPPGISSRDIAAHARPSEQLLRLQGIAAAASDAFSQISQATKAAQSVIRPQDGTTEIAPEVRSQLEQMPPLELQRHIEQLKSRVSLLSVAPHELRILAREEIDNQIAHIQSPEDLIVRTPTLLHSLELMRNANETFLEVFNLQKELLYAKELHLTRQLKQLNIPAKELLTRSSKHYTEALRVGNEWLGAGKLFHREAFDRNLDAATELTNLRYLNQYVEQDRQWLRYEAESISRGPASYSMGYTFERLKDRVLKEISAEFVKISATEPLQLSGSPLSIQRPDMIDGGTSQDNKLSREQIDSCFRMAISEPRWQVTNEIIAFAREIERNIASIDTPEEISPARADARLGRFKQALRDELHAIDPKVWEIFANDFEVRQLFQVGEKAALPGTTRVAQEWVDSLPRELLDGSSGRGFFDHIRLAHQTGLITVENLPSLIMGTALLENSYGQPTIGTTHQITVLAQALKSPFFSEVVELSLNSPVPGVKEAVKLLTKEQFTADSDFGKFLGYGMKIAEHKLQAERVEDHNLAATVLGHSQFGMTERAARGLLEQCNSNDYSTRAINQALRNIHNDTLAKVVIQDTVEAPETKRIYSSTRGTLIAAIVLRDADIPPELIPGLEKTLNLKPPQLNNFLNSIRAGRAYLRHSSFGASDFTNEKLVSVLAQEKCAATLALCLNHKILPPGQFDLDALSACVTHYEKLKDDLPRLKELCGEKIRFYPTRVAIQVKDSKGKATDEKAAFICDPLYVAAYGGGDFGHPVVLLANTIMQQGPDHSSKTSPAEKEVLLRGAVDGIFGSPHLPNEQSADVPYTPSQRSIPHENVVEAMVAAYSETAEAWKTRGSQFNSFLSTPFTRELFRQRPDVAQVLIPEMIRKGPEVFAALSSLGVEKIRAFNLTNEHLRAHNICVLEAQSPHLGLTGGLLEQGYPPPFLFGALSNFSRLPTSLQVTADDVKQLDSHSLAEIGGILKLIPPQSVLAKDEYALQYLITFSEEPSNRTILSQLSAKLSPPTGAEATLLLDVLRMNHALPEAQIAQRIGEVVKESGESTLDYTRIHDRAVECMQAALQERFPGANFKSTNGADLARIAIVYPTFERALRGSFDRAEMVPVLRLAALAEIEGKALEFHRADAAYLQDIGNRLEALLPDAEIRKAAAEYLALKSADSQYTNISADPDRKNVTAWLDPNASLPYILTEVSVEDRLIAVRDQLDQIFHKGHLSQPFQEQMQRGEGLSPELLSNRYRALERLKLERTNPKKVKGEIPAGVSEQYDLIAQGLDTLPREKQVAWLTDQQTQVRAQMSEAKTGREGELVVRSMLKLKECYEVWTSESLEEIAKIRTALGEHATHIEALGFSFSDSFSAKVFRDNVVGLTSAIAADKQTKEPLVPEQQAVRIEALCEELEQAFDSADRKLKRLADAIGDSRAKLGAYGQGIQLISDSLEKLPTQQEALEGLREQNSRLCDTLLKSKEFVEIKTSKEIAQWVRNFTEASAQSDLESAVRMIESHQQNNQLFTYRYEPRFSAVCEALKNQCLDYRDKVNSVGNAKYNPALLDTQRLVVVAYDESMTPRMNGILHLVNFVEGGYGDPDSPKQSGVLLDRPYTTDSSPMSTSKLVGHIRFALERARALNLPLIIPDFAIDTRAAEIVDLFEKEGLPIERKDFHISVDPGPSSGVYVEINGFHGYTSRTTVPCSGFQLPCNGE